MTTTSTSARRSGNPARRAAANDLGESTKRPTTPDAPHRSASRTLLRLGVTAALAFLLVNVALYAWLLVHPLAWLAVMLIPVAVTLWRIPATRRGGLHRWPTVWLLWHVALANTPLVLLLTTAVAQTWVLHRFWTVEFPPGRRDDGGGAA